MSLTNERVHAAGAALPLPDGYEEWELEIISIYHQTLCASDRRWLRVNQFSEKLREAMEMCDFDAGCIQIVCESARDGDAEIVIPRTRSLTRLLWENLL